MEIKQGYIFNTVIMNKVFQSIIIALMSAMIPFLSSCNDDDSVVSEWDMSYVSLLRSII